MVNLDSGRDDNTSERNASLEIDKMQGTQYPPSGIDFNGRQYSLQGIYADAGVSLSIQTDESDIPDLAGPDSKYDLAELHSLMTSYRNSTPVGTGNDMSAYLVVVTNYNDDGVLGIMFDSTTRLGTAVFYGNRMIREDPKAFLRTSAHELGHQSYTVTMRIRLILHLQISMTSLMTKPQRKIRLMSLYRGSLARANI